MSVKIYSGHVAGLPHHNYESVADSIKPGDELDLVREPDNAFDPNAIAIYHNEQKIGYVKAIHTGGIHPYFDKLSLRTIITDHDRQVPHWKAVKFSVLASPKL